MEIRSRIAAETAAVVPFHCIICFEEFHLVDRLPVVLPCGHTFVCGPCSKRLQRCMECREPLFYTIPKKTQTPMTTCSQTRSRGNNATAAAAGSTAGGRAAPAAPLTPPHHGTTSTSPPHPSTVTKVAFPIPKNLVLISIMEAAQSAQRLDGHNSDTTLLDDSSSLNQNDGEEFDLKRILTGVATLSGSCGTFVVKAREGLSILPSLPDIQDVVVEDKNPHNVCLANESSFEILKPLRLEQGQTVQVVTFENGYAKLARGMGFVKATPNELVKVGAPLDRSCQLEGQLETLALQMENLEKELNQTKELQGLLLDQVRRLQLQPPTHPVITEVPLVADECSKENKEQDLLGTPTGVAALHDDVLSSRETTNRTNTLDRDDPLVFPFDGLRLPGSALPNYRRSNSNETLQELGFGCNAFLGEGAPFFSMSSNDNPMLQAASSEDRRRYGSDDQTYVPSLTASFDTVDFRTGMSCHRGLLQTNHRHSPTPRGRGIRYMMSEHRGIASGTSSRHNNHRVHHHITSEASPPR